MFFAILNESIRHRLTQTAVEKQLDDAQSVMPRIINIFMNNGNLLEHLYSYMHITLL